MDHPFKVGERYSNRRGTYEVVEIDDDSESLLVRYEGESTVTSLRIDAQLRILQNMSTDERRPVRSPRRGTGPRKMSGLASPAKSETLTTADRGRQAVIRHLEHLGAVVTEAREGNRRVLVVRTAADNHQVELFVKTRRKGDWQTSTTFGKPRAPAALERRFWVFVDLPDGGSASFYIAPEWWIQNDIHEDDAAYLARHGGERKITKGATHHRIQTERVSQWRDRWDLLGL